MKTKNFKFGGILFLVAGVALLASALLGKLSVFFVLGCAFIAIGGAFVSISRKPSNA